MHNATQVLPGIAILSGAGVYGGDLFAALVLRAALDGIDDQALTTAMGNIHKYGDRRMPALFGIAVLASVLTAAIAAMNARPAVAIAGAVAAVSLAGWLGIFLRVSAPINRAFTLTAASAEALPAARALQRRWDSVVPARAGLQFIALAALCTAIALT